MQGPFGGSPSRPLFPGLFVRGPPPLAQVSLGLLFIGIMQDLLHGGGVGVQRASVEGNAIQKGLAAKGMQDEVSCMRALAFAVSFGPSPYMQDILQASFKLQAQSTPEKQKQRNLS